MKKLLGLLLIITVFSCEKAKETVNKSGKAMGETATEFIDGVAEGVDGTLDSKIILSDSLKEKGINIGKYRIEKDSVGNNNMLVIYIITEKDFNDVLTFKVFDKNNVEYGRQTLELNSKEGKAAYYDVTFDKRTDIESKSIIKVD
ncbi:hypothetical protein KJK34_01495 [Flavobacterium sp. D11R37]|uniref:hypothetical protein n=1 Tax=Flavobacterium coralii TaxID=2838017 RepID=UPI001CA71AE3|nr:hypothetical protein [Flavobacterium coralii]MBY8961417.1 hypothetical protein [Flavobacterium coralii]